MRDVAVVIGASSGLGFEIAALLRERGFSVRPRLRRSTKAGDPKAALFMDPREIAGRIVEAVFESEVTELMLRRQ